MEFRAACSAADPGLGDYTQWVRWRAPIEKNKKTETREKTLTRMAARDARCTLVRSGWRRPQLAVWPGRPEAPGSACLCRLLAPTQWARRSSPRRLGLSSWRHRSPRGVVPKSPSQDGGALVSRLEGVALPRLRP